MSTITNNFNTVFVEDIFGSSQSLEFLFKSKNSYFDLPIKSFPVVNFANFNFWGDHPDYMYSFLSIYGTNIDRIHMENPKLIKLDSAMVTDKAHILLNQNLTIGNRFSGKNIFDLYERTNGRYFGLTFSEAQGHQNKLFTKFYAIENYLLENFKTISDPVLLLSNDKNDKNVYHWFFFCLYIIKFLKDLDLEHLPLLFTYPPTTFQLESLKFFNVKNPLICLENNSVFCKSLFYISKPSPELLDLDTLKWLKTFSLNKSHSFERKLFISRADASKRSIQDEQLFYESLRKIGFERIVMSEYNFYEQVDLFSNASHIVFPHGAAGAFLSFCNPKCKVIEINSSSAPSIHFYLLCNLLGLNFFTYFAEVINNSFVVDSNFFDVSKDFLI